VRSRRNWYARRGGKEEGEGGLGGGGGIGGGEGVRGRVWAGRKEVEGGVSWRGARGVGGEAGGGVRRLGRTGGR